MTYHISSQFISTFITMYEMLLVPCLNMKLGVAERAVGLFGHGDVIGAVGESLGLLGLGRRRHFTTRE